LPVIEAKLIVVAGHANRGEVTVTLPTVIGRSREADLTIAHPMVSRQHCQVFEVDGLLMVRDLDSLNGTMFRGQRIREAPLRPGDEFTIGPLTFRVQYEYQGDLDAVPAPEFAPLEDQPAAAPAIEAIESSWADELTPYDPQAIAVPIEGAAREFAPPQSAEQAEQEKEEEEQPEPTPPPNLAQKPEKRPPIRTSEKNAAAEIKPVEKPDRRQAGDEDSDDPLGWLRE
jgi:pSer/pThr/pTyr-binding forkhead associated (FHA) protein